MIYKIKKNRYEDTIAFKWDGQDSTVKLIDEMIKEVNGSNWEAGRCWNDNTQQNDSDILFISETDGCGYTSVFFNLNEYGIRFNDGIFISYSAEHLIKENIILSPF